MTAPCAVRGGSEAGDAPVWTRIDMRRAQDATEEWILQRRLGSSTSPAGRSACATADLPGKGRLDPRSARAPRFRSRASTWTRSCPSASSTVFPGPTGRLGIHAGGSNRGHCVVSLPNAFSLNDRSDPLCRSFAARHVIDAAEHVRRS